LAAFLAGLGDELLRIVLCETEDAHTLLPVGFKPLPALFLYISIHSLSKHLAYGTLLGARDPFYLCEEGVWDARYRYFACLHGDIVLHADR
jgi:hypothetical protein